MIRRRRSGAVAVAAVVLGPEAPSRRPIAVEGRASLDDEGFTISYRLRAEPGICL